MWYVIPVEKNHSVIGNYKVIRLSSHSEVVLTSGEKVLIDHQDEFLLSVFTSWFRCKNHIAVSRYIQTDYGAVEQRIYLARAITKPSRTFQVDHKNRNTLDNRRCNLRFASASQNSANSVRKTRSKSGYRGVCLANRKSALKKPWCAYIGSSTAAHKNLGYYETKEEAARAYDAAAKKKYGEFAILNFER